MPPALLLFLADRQQRDLRRVDPMCSRSSRLTSRFEPYLPISPWRDLQVEVSSLYQELTVQHMLIRRKLTPNPCSDLLAPGNSVVLHNHSGAMRVESEHHFRPTPMPFPRAQPRGAQNPQKRFVEAFQNPAYRHSSHGTPPYQYFRPASKASVGTFKERRANPVLTRSEDQLRDRIQTIPGSSRRGPPVFRGQSFN